MDDPERSGRRMPRRRGSSAGRAVVVACLTALLVAACQTGAYALECEQGVQREPCERVGAFGYEKAGVGASRVHVQARSCTRYFDSPPAETSCWSVRVESGGDLVVVAVTQTGDGELTEAHDLNPIFPSPAGE
jgi:hypothetical protein